MNRVQRTAILAFVLLLLMAGAGLWLGGKQAQPADAKPSAVLLDPGALETVRLLPPEQRKRYVSTDRFSAPPVDNPLKPNGGRTAGGSLPDVVPDDSGIDLVNASYRTIRVHQNETLGLIAKRELGKAGAWRDLSRWNGIKDDESIKVGQKLKIYDDLYAAGESAKANQAASKSESESLVDIGGDPAPGTRYHTVKSGEILGRISQTYYNTATKVPYIMAANGLDNPHGIKVGQVLTIPPLTD